MNWSVRLLCPVLIVVFTAELASCDDWSWQDSHAHVLETGDLQWSPVAFRYRPGDSIRYIDYELGDVVGKTGAER